MLAARAENVNRGGEGGDWRFHEFQSGNLEETGKRLHFKRKSFFWLTTFISEG